MCGIAGIVNAGLAPAEIESALALMRQAMFHRGPDDGGSQVFARAGAGLCAQRLSIIDLATGHQPVANEDETVFAVLNGEIYNHESIRKMLLSHGHRFRGSSDTEAVLHLYEHAGLDFLDQLRGMFALAIYDIRTRRLLLARDGAGMKPLYLARTPQGFLFASEARALFATGLIAPEPHLEAIDTYLATGFVPAPMSAFRGVEKLQPGHFLTVDSSGETLGQFWHIRYSPPDPARGDASYSEELDGLLAQSVRSHLAADVPVGAFLSGGWDSSLVTTLAAQAAGGKLQTFSAIFPDDPDVDESRFSRQMALQLGTHHYEIEYRSHMLPALLPQVARHLEEPCANVPAAVFYLLASLAGPVVKTVLSGEGADELFGGYERFRVGYPYHLRPFVPQAPARWAASSLEPTRLRRGLQLLAAPNAAIADAELVRNFAPSDKRRMLRPEFRASGPDLAPALIAPPLLASCTGTLQRRLAYEITGRMPNALLFTADKVSMAHSLEVRMPFLDRSIMEFAARLPAHLKVFGGREKVILSALARRHLPPAIAARRKQGLSYPSKAWARPPLDKYVRELLLDGAGPFHQTYIERRFPPGREPSLGESQISCLVMLQLWWNEFAGSPAVRPLSAAASSSGIQI